MKWKIGIALLAVAAPAFATDYGAATVAQIMSIYDADTFTVDIAGWPPIAGRRISVRVAGIDAPEIKGKCPAEKEAAIIAKQAAVAVLRGAKVIELRQMDRDKYFRILADVYADGRSLAEHLIQKGHARRYDGGHKAGWCGK